MTDGKFSEELRRWRGKRRQKEAAAILGVSLNTYRGWEYKHHNPPETCRSCLLTKMSENPPKE